MIFSEKGAKSYVSLVKFPLRELNLVENKKVQHMEEEIQRLLIIAVVICVILIVAAAIGLAFRDKIWSNSQVNLTTSNETITEDQPVHIPWIYIELVILILCLSLVAYWIIDCYRM